MSAHEPVIPEHVQMCAVNGDLTTGADDAANNPAANGDGTLQQRRAEREEKARQRRWTADKVRRAAIKAAQDPRPRPPHASAAGTQSALANVLAQTHSPTDTDAPADAVVWRYLSADAKPLDQWATGQAIAKHSHFTPFCQPDEDEDLFDLDEPSDPDHTEAVVLDRPEAPSSEPDLPDSGVADLLLLSACFAAFPLGLIMAGLPNAVVILAALLHKLKRRRRFSNGLFALVLVLSLVGLVAGALRGTQIW